MKTVYQSDIAAGAAIDKGQFVKISGGEWVPGAANDDAVEGVACETVESGDLVKVAISGPADVLIGSQLTLHSNVMCDANGKAVDATTGGGEVQAGQALETGASDASGFARVNLYPNKVAA